MQYRRHNLRRLARPSLLACLLPLTLGIAAQSAPTQQVAPASQPPQIIQQHTAPRQATAQVLLPAAAPQRVFVNTAQHMVSGGAAGQGAAAPNRSSAIAPRLTSAPLTRLDVRRIELLAQAIVAEQRVPGLAVAIVHGGKVISARGYGVTDVRATEPIDAHTVFRLASLSKPFAATLTGMLVAEGALRWDSKISDFMPNLRFADPAAAQRLSVNAVLSHRVGLPHNAFDRDIENYAEYRDVIQRFAYAPMKCRPGDCYAYQNVAFSLIGDVVHASSGQFYDEAVTSRIFKPLGMNDASMGLEGITASPRWAKPHVRKRGGWTSLMPKPTYYRVSPAAGANASISDMAQWLLAQTGYRPDVLPAPLLATLHAPIVTTPNELRGSAWRRERLSAAGYGLGWRVYSYAGHRMVFHGGAVQGYRGAVALLPDQDLGVAILWNSESSLPTGLLPTILDQAIGLPYHAWLDLPKQYDDPETRYAGPASASGIEASTANAAPE